MCIAFPVRILSLATDTAVVAAGQTPLVVGRRLLPEAHPGDWVLVSAGQMVSVVSPEEAEVLREMLQEIRALSLEAGSNGAEL